MPSVDEVLGPGSPLARRLEGYETREGQLAMARAVHAALERDRHLFVEAGTGTGKTFAYLVPAVLSGRTVVVSTATHALQEQIFEKDIPFVRAVLAEHGIDLRAALMKGLSNYLCKRRFHERMRSGEPVNAELVAIERWALETQTGDRAELSALGEEAAAWRDVHSGTDTRIGAGCKYFDECHVTRMRRAAETAQVIVVNHHLFFADLALKTGKNGGYGGAIPPYDAVVFDEAHQIEGVATDFFGVRISTARIDRLVADARRAVLGARILDSSSMRILDDVERAAHAFFLAWRGRGDEGRRLLTAKEWTPPRREGIGRLDVAVQALAALAGSHDEDDAMAMIARRAAELRTDLGKVHASAEAPHWTADEDEPPPGSLPRHPEHAILMQKARTGFEGGITWIDARERSVSLGASPVDLSPVLREKLFDRVASVVCTSATLATATHAGPSFHFAKGRLGAHAGTEELVVPSPFDFAARAAFYVAEDMPEPNAPGFEQACARRAKELADVTGGGAFVLCTSNRAMRAIHGELARAELHGPLLLQGEAPKHTLLERFRAATNAILVATMSFWEGVDVPGHALRLVVIDKIPFAVPTEPIVAARSAKIEAEGGNPFTQYTVPAAAITLKQGFGRLIRTRQDAGIVALLDRRATKRGYGRALLESLPPARRVRTMDEARDFWQALD
ncbi:MAG: ATP-dependent DNA helicase [Labilithrix sp.]|nr:ATP-dependent DNA helicase [Labilithrix sp.]MCW5813856.1 ATP-dependent DNA helicase [Labilithrix sp.]